MNTITKITKDLVEGDILILSKSFINDNKITLRLECGHDEFDWYLSNKMEGESDFFLFEIDDISSESRYKILYHIDNLISKGFSIQAKTKQTWLVIPQEIVFPKK